MALIKTLIVDDEDLARTRIVRYLNNFAEFQIVGEASDGKEALAKIKQLKVDLVFLDIQMPDMNGFDVLKELKIDSYPFIIFVTAYSQYALKAFDFYALDYLVKPFDRDRFDKCIFHIIERTKEKKHAELNQKIVSLLHFTSEQNNYISTLTVKDNLIWLELDLKQVFYLEAQGNYVSIHLKDKSYLHRMTLTELEKIINPDRFKRIHRSLIINQTAVKKITYKNNNEFQIDLTNSISLKSGRNYRSVIDSLI